MEKYYNVAQNGDNTQANSYQPSVVSSVGDSYQPTVKVTAAQNIIPPSGGSGAITLKTQVVGVDTSKK
jgi:hypothetical protein